MANRSCKSCSKMYIFSQLLFFGCLKLIKIDLQSIMCVFLLQPRNAIGIHCHTREMCNLLNWTPSKPFSFSTLSKNSIKFYPCARTPRNPPSFNNNFVSASHISIRKRVFVGRVCLFLFCNGNT
jgi:hypothetical protein